MITKKMGMVAIGAAVVLSLAGCKMTAHYTLHQDDTVSGELIMAIDKTLAEGMTPEDISGMLGGSDTVSGIEGVVSQPYDDGSNIGNKYTFENQPLESVASSIDGTLVHEGDTFVYTGNPIDPTQFEGSEQYLEGADLSMSITFPGAVTDTNGSVKGTTVTWNLLTQTEAPFATGGAIGTGDSGSGDGMPLWVWLAIAGGAIVLIAVIVMLSKRGKDEAAPAEAEAPAKPAEKNATDKK